MEVLERILDWQGLVVVLLKLGVYSMVSDLGFSNVQVEFDSALIVSWVENLRCGFVESCRNIFKQNVHSSKADSIALKKAPKSLDHV